MKLLFILIFFILASNSLYSQWFWQYPKPQGNTIREVSMLNKNFITAAGDLSTIMKTTDMGVSWKTLIHHSGGSSYDLYGVHFIDELNGWAIGGIWWTDKNVILKTTDGGNNWLEVKTHNILPLNSVWFVDSDTGIAVGEDGIVLRTTDSGKSWDIKKMDEYMTPHLFLDVYRLLKVVFTDKMNGWIIGSGYYGNQIYKTTDCGRSWTWMNQAVTPRIYSSLYDISFVGKNNVYCVGDKGVFIKSTDGGQSWKYFNLSKKYNNEKYQYFSSICFTDSSTGWISGGGYYSIILKTTDAGETWTEVDSAKYYGQLYRIRFTDKDNGLIWGRGGLFLKTTDAGNNWSSNQDEIHALNSIYFTDNNTGWAVGDSCTVVHTSDGGNTWTRQTPVNRDIILNSVYALDKDNAWAVGRGNNTAGGYQGKLTVLMHTTDGGKTWITKENLVNTFTFQSVFFQNNTIGWITGSDGTLLRTIDGGISWHIISVNTDRLLDKIQFVNDSTGWVSFYRGNTILKTTDRGNSWKVQVIDTTLNQYSLTFYTYSFYFINESQGWIVGDNNSEINILRTIDGGDNWTPCKTPPVASYSSVRFFNENTGYAAGYNDLNNTSVIIKTTDGGNSWFDLSSPFKEGITNIFFLNAKTGWAIGNGIVKTTNGGGIVSVKENDKRKFQSIIPTQTVLMQNYPNPFNPATTIYFSIQKESHIELKVFDMLGREVSTLVNEQKPSGEYKVQFNASSLPSGIYIYTLQAGSFRDSKKLILIK